MFRTGTRDGVLFGNGGGVKGMVEKTKIVNSERSALGVSRVRAVRAWLLLAFYFLMPWLSFVGFLSSFRLCSWLCGLWAAGGCWGLSLFSPYLVSSQPSQASLCFQTLLHFAHIKSQWPLSSMRLFASGLGFQGQSVQGQTER